MARTLEAIERNENNINDVGDIEGGRRAKAVSEINFVEERIDCIMVVYEGAEAESYIYVRARKYKLIQAHTYKLVHQCKSSYVRTCTLRGRPYVQSLTLMYEFVRTSSYIDVQGFSYELVLTSSYINVQFYFCPFIAVHSKISSKILLNSSVSKDDMNVGALIRKCNMPLDTTFLAW